MKRMSAVLIVFAILLTLLGAAFSDEKPPNRRADF